MPRAFPMSLCPGLGRALLLGEGYTRSALPRNGQFPSRVETPGVAGRGDWALQGTVGVSTWFACCRLADLSENPNLFPSVVNPRNSVSTCTPPLSGFVC